MQTAIIKTPRFWDWDGGRWKIFWMSVIKGLQDKKFKVMRNFKDKADLNIVLSGAFENPRGYTGKRVMFLNKHEWQPPKTVCWDYMYRDIIKHYYDEIVDVSDKNPKEVVDMVIDYIKNAELQWKANQS